MTCGTKELVVYLFFLLGCVFTSLLYNLLKEGKRAREGASLGGIGRYVESARIGDGRVGAILY